MKKLFAILAMALALAGCDKAVPPSSFQSVDVTGLGYARNFKLTDHNGKLRSLADFRGKVVVMFFGFTQCPDVCPTTMIEMAQVLKLLGEQSKDVQVLFVTVDPERDSQELLQQYVPAFHPSFIGLRGDEAATDAVMKEFKVVRMKSAGKTPTSYMVEHTAASFVFDKEGKVRLYVRPDITPEALAADIKQLL